MAQSGYSLLDAAIAVAHEAGTAKILIVENELPYCQGCSAALCQANPGYGKLLAYTGMEGVKIALRNHPDLVTLDLNPPDVSTMQVVQYFRASENLWATPIIITTGQGVDGLNTAVAFNAAVCLTKPIDLNAFISVVEDALTGL